MKALIELFLLFAKIGATTFGGGYAMLPLLQREIVEKRGWLTEAELTDVFAIGQCTPGIIAINTATFVGYKQKGVLGGIFATLGMVFPSLVIISVIAAFLKNFAQYKVVQHAFAGIRACVCVLIVNAVIKLWKSAVIDKFTIVIYFVVLIVSVFTSVPAVFLVLGAGLAGIVIGEIRHRKKEGTR